MNPRLTFLSVSLLALALPLMTLACSDTPTETNGTDPPPVIPPDGATVETLLDDVVVPIIEALNLADLARGFNAPLDVDCSPVSLCTGGSAESCPGSGAVEYNFKSCIAHSTEVDGTVVLSGTYARGTATVDVTLDGAVMTGNMAYIGGEACFQQNYNLAADTRDFVVGVNADLEYCSPSVSVGGIAVPNSGGFTLSIAALNRDFDLIFTGTETGRFSVNVWDTEKSENILTCSGVLYGNLDCEVPR